MEEETVEQDVSASSNTESHKVRFQTDTPKPTGKDRLQAELDKCQAADDRQRQFEKEYKRRRVQEQIQRQEEERINKGVEILPDAERSKKLIRGVMRDEEVIAVEKEKYKLDVETAKLKNLITKKYKVTVDSLDSLDLMTLTKDYFDPRKVANDYLPERIRCRLTTEEIDDLKMVFDMFDSRGRGYINSDDVQRAANMLGFRAKKKIFEGMIDAVSSKEKGKVTFVNFLDFVIKTQGEGPDPYEEIFQAFKMLDIEDKGFLTLNNIQEAMEEMKLGASNKVINEMIHEADQTGDGKITLREFVDIMLQTNTFRQV